MSALTLRTLSGFKWQILATGGASLVSLVTVMILARLLTPEDFGQLAVAQAFISLADILGQRGLGPAIVQRFRLTRRHVATGFTLALGSAGLLAGAIWALAPWLVLLVGAPETAPVVQALAPLVLLTGAGLVSEHRLRRQLRFRQLMAATVASKILGSGIVAVGLALMDHGVWALVFGALAQQGAYALAVLSFAPPRGFATGRREAADLVRTGAGFSSLALTGIATSQSLRLLIAGTLGAASLGLYTRSRSLSVFATRFSPLLKRVLLPAMARRQQRVDRLRDVYLNGAEILALGALPVSLMIAVGAEDIVGIVLGPQWSGAVPVLRILSLTASLHAVNALQVPLMRALGALYRETGRRALYLVLLLGAVWLGSRWGLPGVAVAIAATRLVLHTLLAHLTLGLLGIAPRTLLRRFVPALWTALWATAAVWLAAAAARGAQWHPVASLALQLGAWGPAAVAATYFAPRFARPSFPHWGLVQLPFDDMGPSGRWSRHALGHLARRWPAAPCAGTPRRASVPAPNPLAAPGDPGRAP